MRHHLVLRVIAKMLIPMILVYGLYVQFHGDFGPGGGFQAGVIFAAGIILYALIFGLEQARRVAPPAVIEMLVAGGVLLYAGVGFASLLLGGNYLDYDVLAHDPVHGQHLGILLIEFGVGTTVAAVMITIFYNFAGRGRARDVESFGSSRLQPAPPPGHPQHTMALGGREGERAGPDSTNVEKAPSEGAAGPKADRVTDQ